MDSGKVVGNGALKSIVGFVATACAAGVMILLALGSHHIKAPPDKAQTGTMSTKRGEHRCERLPEASEVCLNTGTTVRYVFTGSVRYLEVVTGEATFAVHSDTRPFEVLSGKMVIRDVSTKFDVYKKSGSVLLTVIDGRVKVLARTGNEVPLGSSLAEPEAAWRSAPEFHRLQQVEFDQFSGTLHARATLTEQGLSQLMAWQRGEIDLTDKPLWEALRELARYQPTDASFTFQDREMRQMRVGGRVESIHLDDFLVWLERKHGIQHKLTNGPHGEAVIALSRARNTEAHRQPN